MNNTIDTIDIPSEELIEKEKLKEYSEAINELAISKSSLEFSNKNSKHASIVIATILNYSKNEVLIYDDNLSGNISEHKEIFSLEESIEDFVVRGGKLHIVLSESREILSSLGKKLEFYTEFFKENISVSLASDIFKNSVLFEEKNVFFSVGDKKMYRIENQTNPENRLGKADGSFNDEKTSKKLYDNFMLALNTCEPYFNQEK